MLVAFFVQDQPHRRAGRTEVKRATDATCPVALLVDRETFSELSKLDQGRGQTVEKPVLLPIQAGIDTGWQVLNPKICQGFGQHMRFVGSGFNVDTRLTAPTEVTKHPFAPNNLTAIVIAVQVFGRDKIAKFPCLQKAIYKPRRARIFDRDSGLIPVPLGLLCNPRFIRAQAVFNG